MSYEDVEIQDLLRDHGPMCAGHQTRIGGNHAGIGGDHVHCKHCRDWLKHAEGGSEFEKLMNMLYAGVGLSKTCKVVAAILLDMLEMLAQGVRDEWDDRGFCNDPVKGSQAMTGARKKRVVDGALKEELLKRAAQHKLSATTIARVSSAPAPSTSDKWLLGSCSLYMAALWNIMILKTNLSM